MVFLGGVVGVLSDSSDPRNYWKVLNKNPEMNRGGKSGEDEDGGADFGPVVEPVGIGGVHIDTAVGHGSTKIRVPVRAVKAVTLEKVHGPRNIGQIVTRSGHAGGFQFYIDGVAAGDSREGGDAGGNDKLFEEKAVFVDISFLFRKNDEDLLAFQNCGLRYSNRDTSDKKLLSGIDKVDVGKVIGSRQSIQV